MLKNLIEDGNEDEEASIMTDFDYHDIINAERQERNILKPFASF